MDYSLVLSSDEFIKKMVATSWSTLQQRQGRDLELLPLDEIEDIDAYN